MPGMRALDVGSGSGYLSAVMARMVGEEGKVIGIDYLWPLVDLAVANVHKADADLLNSILEELLQALLTSFRTHVACLAKPFNT